MKNYNQNLPKTVFPFIWHFLSEFKIAAALYIFFSVIAGLWGPLNSILVKNIIDLLPQIQTENASLLIIPASLVVLNFFIFDNITWRACAYIRAKFTPIIINNIISSSMNYVLGHSHQFFQDNLSGKVSKHITNLADGTEKLITSVAANFLRGASLLLASFIAAYFVNPIFCLILIIWFAFFAVASIIMSKRLITLSDQQTAAESLVVGELVDTISNQSNVRIFAKKSYENKHMAPYLHTQQKKYCNTFYYSLIMHSVQGGLITIMMAFSAYFLVKLYAQSIVTAGDFALIFGMAMNTGHMMWFTMSEVDEFNKAFGRCKQSLSAVMSPIEITDKINAETLQCPHGKIQFSDVEFHYKGIKKLFQNKSVSIEAGQKVGLVGYSGSGKSTFVNLIMRLYDITKGKILIDGYDIRNVTQDSLHEHISLIPQDPVLFQRSLMENIRYGRVNATDEEVIEAAKKAFAHEFIIKLSKGYHSLAGERGVKLSGGQRQRIAIARAILKNAPILILDEATSQLDSVTESLIQESLGKLMQNKTTIVIAHRLSTLLHMDRILVFDKGKIVEDGSHKDLLLQNKLYKKLWDTQIGGFLDDSMDSMD